MEIIWLIDRTVAYLGVQLRNVRSTLATIRAEGAAPVFIEACVAEERLITQLMADWHDARDAADDDDEACSTRH